MTIQYDHCFSEVKNRKEGGVREIPRGSNVWLSEGQVRVRKVNEKGRMEVDCSLPQQRVAYEHSEICSRLLQLTDASSWFVKSENRTHSRVPLFPQGIHLARCTPSSSSLPSWSSVLFEWNIKSYMLISRVQHLRRQIVSVLLLIASCLSTLFWDIFILKDLKLIPEFNFPWGTWKRVSNKKRSLSTTPRIIRAGSKL